MKNKENFKIPTNDLNYMKIDSIKKDNIKIDITEFHLSTDENMSIVLLYIDKKVKLLKNCNITSKFNLYNLIEMEIEY